MFRIIRETFQTTRAVCAMTRDFFVRWFLPLHSDDEPDDETPPDRGSLGWNWDDDEHEDERQARPMIGMADDPHDGSADSPPAIPPSDAGVELPGDVGDAPPTGDRA